MSFGPWPFTIDDQIFNAPVANGNQWAINGRDFLATMDDYPSLWKHMKANMNQLQPELQTHMTRVSEPFQPKLPLGTIGRLKVPNVGWQSEEENRYVRLELIHCANYDHDILPFHNTQAQYGFFFIDMKHTAENDEIKLYYDKHKPQSTENEEHTWLDESDIEITYMPKESDEEKDRMIGLKNTVIKYLKHIVNRGLDDYDDEAASVIAILQRRLRGKMRVNVCNKIVSAQGIISHNVWAFLEEKLEEITDLDEEYSTNRNIESYKVKLNDLYEDLCINGAYTLRIYDQFGKEMKMKKSIKNEPLFVDESVTFRRVLKGLCKDLSEKHKNTDRAITSMIGAYGLRFSFNKGTNTIKVKTNTFRYAFRKDDNNRLIITERIGQRFKGW